MPVTVVVGGQFGGEGKGKVSHYLAREMGAKAAVRVGGSNSGHTVIDPHGNALILRQLPTPSILPDVTCVLGAGSYIDVDILLDEIARTGLPTDRLYIDPNAVVITENEIDSEKNSSLWSSIGSTRSGTGAAVIKRISRDRTAKLAKDDERLKQFVRPVVPYMRDLLSQGERIIIEGTQGFGLSLLHSPHYPYATSRDTTAAAFISEAGLSPLDVDDIVLVIRTYPIRVSGNSGPLNNEIDWNTVSSESHSYKELLEFTSVTNTTRRVARFDSELVIQAISTNQPNRIVLNHVDYFDVSVQNGKLNPEVNSIISKLESDIRKKIDFIGISQKEILSARRNIVFPHNINRFDYANTIDAAKERFEEAKKRDPLPHIPPTLLNKRDIAKYVSVTGMIWPFNPDSLKAASYEVKLGKEVLYWDKDENQHHKKELKENDPIVLKRNSITFVSVEPKFFVPFYIALRFNLSITHVHRGLLLGTGPLIDPTFIGKIMIPIHNLTNNDYIVRPGDDLIAVEFTKIWFDSNDHHDINFDKMSINVKKPDMSFNDYFKNALPVNIRSVVSSLEKTVEMAKQYVEKSEGHIQEIKNESIEKIEDIKRNSDKARSIFTGISFAGVGALLITTLATYWQAKSVISDANNYVANSSYALQGNLTKAVDPKGFEKAIQSNKLDLLNINKEQFDKFTKSQEETYAQLDNRIGFIAKKFNQQSDQPSRELQDILYQIESIKNEIKIIKAFERNKNKQ